MIAFCKEKDSEKAFKLKQLWEKNPEEAKQQRAEKLDKLIEQVFLPCEIKLYMICSIIYCFFFLNNRT
jgi:hypothetical protein